MCSRRGVRPAAKRRRCCRRSRRRKTSRSTAWCRRTRARARAFLIDVGNPFSRIDLDTDGRASIEWGVYGVPETFVIDGQGIIRLRYAGPLTPDALTSVILPAIARASEPV